MTITWQWVTGLALGIIFLEPDEAENENSGIIIYIGPLALLIET